MRRVWTLAAVAAVAWGAGSAEERRPAAGDGFRFEKHGAVGVYRFVPECAACSRGRYRPVGRGAEKREGGPEPVPEVELPEKRLPPAGTVLPGRRDAKIGPPAFADREEAEKDDVIRYEPPVLRYRPPGPAGGGFRRFGPGLLIEG